MENSIELMAICVPTRNHSDVVKDVLEETIEVYTKHNIDVYYYDSSDDNKTKDVIEDFQNKGFSNLFYIRVPREWGVDYKTEKIFSKYAFEKEYKYIIPVKDRAFFSDHLCEKMKEEMEKDYDLLLLGAKRMRVENSLDDGIYNNPKEFYKDYGWLVTSLDIVAYRYKSMLEDFDMKVFNTENAEKEHNIYWVAYFWLFNKLLDNKVVKIIYQSEKVDIKNTKLGKSSWTKETFKIWKDYWIDVNNDLPDYYNEYKAHVIKKAASLPWLLDSVDLMMELYESGVLNSENIKDILYRWEEVSNISKNTMVKIASGTYDPLHDTSILDNSWPYSVSIINNLIDKIKEGTINCSTIPFDMIAELVVAEISVNIPTYCVIKHIIKGSILDTVESMKTNPTRHTVEKGLQALISYMLLSSVQL